MKKNKQKIKNKLAQDKPKSNIFEIIITLIFIACFIYIIIKYGASGYDKWIGKPPSWK